LDLDLVNGLIRDLKEKMLVQDFTKDLSKYIEKNLSVKEMPIVEQILKEKAITRGNENAIRFKADEVITQYARENFGSETMYFVKDNKKTYWMHNARHYDDSAYSVLKIANGEMKEIAVDKKDMPKEISVNDVFRLKDDKYIIDKISTNELQTAIKNMANEVIEKQNRNLSKHRKEGHLYMVTEELKESRFLLDTTESTGTEFEEVDFPKDLLEKATQGTIFMYTNGTYEYYNC